MHLMYEHKSMSEKRETEFTRVSLCHLTDDGKALVTYQGLHRRVMAWCDANGHTFELRNKTNFSTKPNFLKMFGFRFSQRELTTKFLEQDLSGCLEAPTRYGKSSITLNLVRAFPDAKIVVTMPGTELLEQTYAFLKKNLPTRRVAGVWGGGPDKAQNDDVSVVSMDSLHKCDFEGTEVVIVDEAHAAVTDSRGFKINSFQNARRIGLGATLHGRFDKADILIEGILGPVLSARTFTEAVKEGAICPIAAVLIHYELDVAGYKRRDVAYQRLVWENEKFIEFVRRLHAEVVPREYQSLLFIAREEQADMVNAAIQRDDPDGVVAMAKKLSKKERTTLFEKIGTGTIRRVTASKIYSTGVTFPDIRTASNLEGGAAYISCVQKPGRLSEVKPGKKYGILFDFVFHKPKPTRAQHSALLEEAEGLDAICADSHTRMVIYSKKGYKIHHVKADIDQIKQLFQTLI